nr:PREDICTED: coiled-coil domain-containing protein 105 [Anolis carolinensis]|eukprot:XP_008103788.1 PREDICTED: coiled-coil domain-containing protein 105 [Anolis carolinensis]
MGPPAHLVTGKVGAEKWHKETLAKVRQTGSLTKRCGKEALDLWCPVSHPDQPEETPYERKVRKDAWKFKLDVLATGEVKTKPPEGPGVTLWKSKVKPPPWISKIALPCCRDFSTLKNNEYVAQYFRETRLVVSRLRQAIIEINEQYKRLMHLREELDLMLDKIRQGLITNRQSQAIREHRPESEKASPLLLLLYPLPTNHYCSSGITRWRVKITMGGTIRSDDTKMTVYKFCVQYFRRNLIPDKVDGLMKWERAEFLKLKAKLEKMMATSGDHLKALGKCRENLNTLCGERGQVLDLVPQPLRMVLLGAGRDSWLGLSRPSSPWVERNETPIPDPVGPFTPECAAAVEECRRLTFLTKDVLVEVQKAIDEAQEIRNTTHCFIDLSLQGKREETLTHKERLDMTLAGTRSTLHRCKRFQHEMCITRGMALGPVSSKYLETREKLTRPMVKVFQRHVGTQLPEAAILNQSTAQLDRSIADTDENIAHLKATRRYLRECIHDKQTGYEVDGSIKRLRERRMHPHTTMKETLELVYT